MGFDQQVGWDVARAVSVRLPHLDLELILDEINACLSVHLTTGDVVTARKLSQLVDDVTERLRNGL